VSQELLDWVTAYLEADEEIVVPVKRMWNEWRAAHAEPDLPAFSALVLADDRIEAMGAVDYDEGMVLDAQEAAEYTEQMEASGYYSGPRVKLKSRELTFEHVARMITRHNDRLEAALNAARAAMPADIGEQEEGALIHVLELAKELREKLREAGLELDDPPGDEAEGDDADAGKPS
jgi:hypothetical protein